MEDFRILTFTRFVCEFAIALLFYKGSEGIINLFRAIRI